MLKKLSLIVTAIAMLLMLASPAHAMLRVLEPELSNELKTIAQEHVANTQNVDAANVTINEAWLREFFGLKVDVYMVTATIDSGLPTEQIIEIPVRVDSKTVLSTSELDSLIEQDAALTPDEPIARAMVATEDTAAVEQAVPVVESAAATNYMIYYIAGVVLILVVLAGGYVAIRSKA